MIWVLRLWLTGKPPPAPGVLAATLWFEVLALTACFLTTGGSSSPFTALYLVPVVVSAMTLRGGRAWSVPAVSVLAYASMFWLTPENHHHDHQAMQLHVAGMFAAYAVTAAGLTVGFQHLREGQRALAQAKRQADADQARTQRLAGLATLAAGASHELASPLSTILVVAGELRRKHPDETDDLVLIQEEVKRCQDVLDQLSVDVGVGPGDALERVEARAWVGQAVGQIPGVHCAVEAGEVEVPPRRLSQVLHQLIQNAQQAGAQHIELRGRFVDHDWVIDVADDGPGMTPQVQAHALEPFFSTKGRDGGLGLGLYFVAAVLEPLGGEMTLQSAPGQGTTITLTLPRSHHAGR